MDGVKGNAAVNVGYSCHQRELVKGWRAIWSETGGTTDPLAPYGVVTLASSGSEGGPNMGAMRLAQVRRFTCVIFYVYWNCALSLNMMSIINADGWVRGFAER